MQDKITTTASDQLLTRKEAAELSGAPASLINKAIEHNLIGITSVKGSSLLKPNDMGALALFARVGTAFALPRQQKRQLTKWVRDAEVGAEFELAGPLIIRKTGDVARVIEEATRYVEQRERFLEINPDRQGGEPVIRSTRVPIRGLAKQIEAGESRTALKRQYDYMDPEAFDFAVRWARANPRRGRPSAGQRGEQGPEPVERQAYLATRRRRTASTA